jgi:hypothetical protein
LDATVPARRRGRGAEHPATRAAHAAQAGAYDQAADALERDLREHMAAFGPEHPETVALRTELAQLRAARPEPPRQRTAPEPGAAVPRPRRPRGARFLRSSEPSEEGTSEEGTSEGPPDTGRRPRGARFSRRGR